MNRHCTGSLRAIFPRRSGAAMIVSVLRNTPAPSNRSARHGARSRHSRRRIKSFLDLIAAGLTHDFNTMLHISIGPIELMQNRIDGV